MQGDKFSIETFKQWFLEISDEAIETKKIKARNKGDESKWKNEIWSSPNKNRDIKARFCDEGEILGYRSRPSYKSKAGEWLYDFIWREFDESDNLKRVVLTMEIEVSDLYFKYDFNKLLQADSEYKIMVFQVKHEQAIEEVFASLQSAVEAYQSNVQSHYLLVGWSTSNNKFMFKDFAVLG
ncbi:hypothetical protein [Aliivibrio wodanis]|uniref:hypothetical protein n=1 Tax=Aliivibrio wodanis TaxID=80852 RepID=UPI00406CF2D5